MSILAAKFAKVTQAATVAKKLSPAMQEAVRSSTTGSTLIGTLRTLQSLETREVARHIDGAPQRAFELTEFGLLVREVSMRDTILAVMNEVAEQAIAEMTVDQLTKELPYAGRDHQLMIRTALGRHDATVGQVAADLVQPAPEDIEQAPAPAKTQQPMPVVLRMPTEVSEPSQASDFATPEQSATVFGAPFQSGRHVYVSTVMDRDKQARRRRNKVARASRRRNRNR